VTVILKSEITVPTSVRRKAGFKPGDRVEFKVSDRTITIVPKLTPDEAQDEEEIRDPKIRAAIRKGYQEFLAGKTRPIEEFLPSARRAALSSCAGTREHDTEPAFRGSHHSSLRSALRQVAKDSS
jgi:AbrB family looped-hinge helix DNA binding protein